MNNILKLIDKNKKRILEDAEIRNSAKAKMLIEASINHNHNSCKSTELTLMSRFAAWESDSV